MCLLLADDIHVMVFKLEIKYWLIKAYLTSYFSISIHARSLGEF